MTKNLKELIVISIIIIVIYLIIAKILIWWNEPLYATVPDLGPIPTEIRRAMMKCGPYYYYRIHTDGRLEVLINNQWLNLKY